MNEEIVGDQRGHSILSRRALLRSTFALGLGGLAMAVGGLVLDFLTPRDLKARGIVLAGHYRKYPPGSVTYFRESKFWLAHLTTEEGGPGFLALSEKCPHLGCAVDWEPDLTRRSISGAEGEVGLFNCHCHSSIFVRSGICIFGPSPRALDRYRVTFDPGGALRIDTAKALKGTDDNGQHAVQYRKAN
jgi:cytochrome b6-f complex iron-sulfur subunit